MMNYQKNKKKKSVDLKISLEMVCVIVLIIIPQRLSLAKIYIKEEIKNAHYILILAIREQVVAYFLLVNVMEYLLLVNLYTLIMMKMDHQMKEYLCSGGI